MPATKLNKCSRCGTGLRAGTTPCPHCGSRIIWHAHDSRISEAPRIPFAGDIAEFSEAHGYLVANFSMAELRILCSYLGINPGDLRYSYTGPKANFALSIWDHMKRSRQLEKLNQALKKDC